MPATRPPREKWREADRTTTRLRPATPTGPAGNSTGPAGDSTAPAGDSAVQPASVCGQHSAPSRSLVRRALASSRDSISRASPRGSQARPTPKSAAAAGATDAEEVPPRPARPTPKSAAAAGALDAEKVPRCRRGGYSPEPGPPRANAAATPRHLAGAGSSRRSPRCAAGVLVATEGRRGAGLG